MNALKRITDVVEKLLNFFVAASFAILIIACVLQVFTRFVLNSSLSWTEELARYAFIWANLLGAAICTKKGTHATVTAITESLPEKPRLILKIAVHIVVMAVAYVLIRYGIKVVASTRMQLSPALRISMSFVYASAPVCGLLVMFYSALNLLDTIRLLWGKGEQA